jgi:hypothetical protein
MDKIGLVFYLISQVITLNISSAILFSEAARSQEITVPLESVKPSLWWTMQQLEQGLVEYWDISSKTRQVVITVNAGAWVAKDYVKRYAILQKLGDAVYDQNYSILVQDPRKNRLVEYAKVKGVWQLEPPSLGATPFRPILPSFFSK